VTILTHIDLLRHGEVLGGSRFYGRTDIALTETGWAQMWAATEKTPPCWDHIITSPLNRCAKFATKLSQSYSVPLTQDARLQEFDFGVWEGCSAAEIMATDAAALTDFWQDPVKNKPPHAECLLDFEARVLSTWHDIIHNHADKKILLITHGGVIRAILCHIYGKPIKQMLKFEVKHASLQTIQIEQQSNGCHISKVI
jgi:alpha-ribazole phosphatase